MFAAERHPYLCAGFRGHLVLVALFIGGCSGGSIRELFMMPAPAAYEEAEAPFGDGESAEKGAALLDMLYVTNRAPAQPGDKDKYYSGERGYLVRAGSARIAFGDNDISWDEAREISLLKNRPGQFPLHVEEVSEIGILPNSVTVFTPLEAAPEIYEKNPGPFIDAIEARLARSTVKDIFIYVHGYKVIFENPLLVSSELWHFLGNEGAFVAFSWPSTPKRLAYFKDVETAKVSAWGLRKLIEYLARNTSANRIHIVGFSAGTRVVMNTLYELALIHTDSTDDEIRRATKLGNVILVGSDVDTGLFASEVLDGLLRVQERLTLYTSPSDKALKVSEKVFAHRRMGEIQPGTLDPRMRDFAAATPELALINIAGAEGFDTDNGHAYFRKSPWVSSDVLMTLRYGLAPADRGLVKKDDSPIWGFPEDYLLRFEAALEKVNPELARQLEAKKTASN